MGASWYRDVIQLMEDVKKNGSMLYLDMAFRASRQAKDAPYFVLSMRKTEGVKSSTNNDRTRMPSGRRKSYVISKLICKGRMRLASPCNTVVQKSFSEFFVGVTVISGVVNFPSSSTSVQ
jgi:hypothetical protein